MNQRLNPVMRVIALTLLAITGGLATAVPLLDAHEPFEGPGVEETHDSSRCSYRHDHNLCLLFQQSPAEAAPPSLLRPVAAPSLFRQTPRSTLIANAPRPARYSARAPPTLL